MMKLLYSIFLVTSLAFANSPIEILKIHDVRMYNPLSQGVQDLFFEIDQEGLTKSLNDSLIYGKLERVYYEVYWNYKEGLLVEVKGMPKGFHQKKAQLAALIQNKFDLIIPASLHQRYKDLKFRTASKTQDYQTIIAEFEDNPDINDIILRIAGDGRLLEMTVNKPIGTEKSELRYESKNSWSKGKWALSGYEVKQTYGSQVIVSTNLVEYDTFDGFGLPSVFKSVTTQTPNQPASLSGDDKYTRTVNYSLTFKNYKVNQGVGAKKLRDAKN